jgi:hypothetical protein
MAWQAKSWRRRRQQHIYSSTSVPTYLGLDLVLGFFCEVGFVSSTNVSHDAHALGVKCGVTSSNSIAIQLQLYVLIHMP